MLSILVFLLSFVPVGADLVSVSHSNRHVTQEATSLRGYIPPIASSPSSDVTRPLIIQFGWITSEWLLSQLVKYNLTIDI